jgi:hypothetical protein
MHVHVDLVQRLLAPHLHDFVVAEAVYMSIVKLISGAGWIIRLDHPLISSSHDYNYSVAHISLSSMIAWSELKHSLLCLVLA